MRISVWHFADDNRFSDTVFSGDLKFLYARREQRIGFGFDIQQNPVQRLIDAAFIEFIFNGTGNFLRDSDVDFRYLDLCRSAGHRR